VEIIVRSGIRTKQQVHEVVEEALKKSESMYRLLADNISEHVWIMDLDLKLTYISPSVKKLCLFLDNILSLN
jgi:PAS domain-containing protein